MTMNAAVTLLEGGESARTALVCGSEQVTYSALRDDVARAAGAWRRRGMRDGDRVAIKLSDGCAWVRAYLGAIWAGGVAVAVNPRISVDEWRFIVGEGRFGFVLAESTKEDSLQEVRDRVIALDEWLRDAASAIPAPPAAMDQESPAFWCHSSGTSGKPKAVVHAHRFALHVARPGAEILGIRSDDRLFATSKLFFAYPLGNSLFTGLKVGATVILDPQWPSAASVAETIVAQRPTVLFSVPSLYRNLLKDGFAARLAEHGLRRCVSAGEALPSALRDAWRRETGIGIVDGYGASETLSLALLDIGDGEGLSPAPGVCVQALDPHAAAPMRLRVDTPTRALGYWNRPDADRESFRDGAFCPADLFEPMSTGAWRFMGREDCLMKIGGRWVNLIALEQRLAAGCPSVSEAAVVATTDGDGVAALALFYVPKADASVGADGGLKLCVDALPPHQRPQWLHCVPSLPRTATGKLLRRKLQELHQTLAAREQAAPVGTPG